MIQYRVATTEDLKQVAAVHRKCFKGYFLTTLGENLLIKYYSYFLSESDLFVIAQHKGKVIGFCMGYLKGSTARREFQKQHNVRIAIRILLNCLRFNMVTIKRMLKTLKIRNKNNSKKNYKADGDLLSICLLPEYRGQGVADEMLKNFEQILKNHSCKNYTLTVRASNIAARRFYKKKGFLLYKEGKDECIYLKRLDL
jgi:ribosomal protein S18 acetylase RimI-like enzyme